MLRCCIDCPVRCLKNIQLNSQMQEVERLSNKLTLLQEFVQALESYIQALHRQIAENKKIQAMNQSDLQRTLQQLDVALGQNDRLRRENRQLLQSMRRGESKERQQRAAIGRLEKQKDRLMARIEQLSQANQALLHPQAHTHPNNSQTTKTIESQSQLIAQKNQLILQLKSKQEQYEQQIIRLGQIIVVRTQQLSSLKEKQKQDEVLIQVYNTQRDNLKKLLKQEENNRRVLKEALATLHRNAGEQKDAYKIVEKVAGMEIQAQMQGLQKDNQQLNEERNHMIQVINNLERELMRKQQQSLQLTIQVTDLEKQIDINREGLTKQIMLKEQEIHQNKQKCEEMSNCIATQEKTITQNYENIKNISQENMQYRNQIKQMEEAMKQITESTQRKIKQAMSNSEEETMYQQTIKNLKSQLASLQASQESIRKKHDESISLIRNQNKRIIKQYEEIVSSKTKEINMAEMEVEQLKLKTQKMQQIIVEKEEQLRRKEERLRLAEQQLKQREGNGTQTEFSLRQTIRELNRKQQIQAEEIHQLRLRRNCDLIALQNSSNVQQSLKQLVLDLQNNINSNKAEKGVLISSLNDKQKEINGLEESNATLRRLVITAKASEEEAMRQLQQLKSNNGTSRTTLTRNGSALTVLADAQEGSRNNNRSLRKSSMNENRASRASKTNKCLRQESHFKKRTTPDLSKANLPSDEESGRGGKTEQFCHI